MNNVPPGPILPHQLRAWIDKQNMLLDLNWDQLPKLPPWAPLFGYTEEWHRATVVHATSRAAVVLGRRLEAPEKYAMARSVAANNISLSYSPAVWLIAALAFERRERKSFRFPFYTPKKIDPLRFPLKSAPILRGPLAVAAWHCSRFTCYAIMGNIFMQPMVAGAITISTFKNMMRDPNLDEFNKAMKKLNVKEARSIDVDLVRKLEAIYESPEDPSMRDASAPYFGGQEQEPAQEAPASPPSSWDRYRSRAAGGQRPAQPPTQPEQPSWSPQGDRNPPLPDAPEPDSEFDGDDGYLFDDASPVAPDARRPQRSGASPSPPEASSWDEIRKEAQARANAPLTQRGSSQPWAQRRFQASQQASRSGQENEGYTYSQDDEEKAYAKEQAQRDFDAMIERERLSEAGGESRGRR